MLYREIIAVCSQIHTKHINTLCGQNVELLNVKLAVHTVVYSNVFPLFVCLTGLKNQPEYPQTGHPQSILSKTCKRQSVSFLSDICHTCVYIKERDQKRDRISLTESVQYHFLYPSFWNVRNVTCCKTESDIHHFDPPTTMHTSHL